VIIRPARVDDAVFAVEMIYATMGAMADQWFGFGSHERAIEKLTWFFSRPENQFSYTYAEILEEDDKPAAFLLAMSGKELGRLLWPMFRQAFGAYGVFGALRLILYTLPMIFEKEAEEDEYYISNLAVGVAFRRRGLAEILLRRAEERAMKLGLNKCSLTVELGNEHARGLYLKTGYRVVDVTKNAWLRTVLATPGWERMVKTLQPKK
jgi:ribosomal protein S18 acetylase RimI-like enzyme